MILDSIQLETAPNPKASVIWMHGLGADGNDFVPIVQEMSLSGILPIRFIFPHAPSIPVTINDGYVMPAWYDILSPDLSRSEAHEDAAGLRRSQRQIETLIAKERAQGIAASKIVLAGFSQGGAMALFTGLRYRETLGGLICLSGYVPLADQTASERDLANQPTPILMAHGTQDPIVPISRAQGSRDLLIKLGYRVQWHEYPMPHSVCPQEVLAIERWINAMLN